MMHRLSAIIITKNEAANIEACLESVGFCDEIIVVDSMSADETVALAKKVTSKVTQRAFDDFSSQKNYALSLATHEWVLSIDADERISQSLRAEIKEVMISDDKEISAYALPRHNFMFGKRLRFGASRADAPLRLFRKKKASFGGIIHESLKVEGSVGKLTSPLLHYSTQTIQDYMRKLDQYTKLEAQLLYREGKSCHPLTLCVKPVIRFFQRYVWQLGILDGRSGFIFSALSGIYEFVRYSKLWELHRLSVHRQSSEVI